MSVGQNLILPFIFFYLPAAVSQTRLWLSAFPLSASPRNTGAWGNWVWIGSHNDFDKLFG
jgi:hypothetical protein